MTINKPNEINKAKAAYIHIPFCSQICYYCDFAKVLLEGQPVDNYIDELLVEYDSNQITNLRTIYIGGGTPTVLNPEQMKKLLDGLTKNLDLAKLEEFTVEANPGDLSVELVQVLANSPVNRISLGVQTFNNPLLKKIGRTHTDTDVYEAIDMLQAAGFENITIDLIYGLPGQTMEMVEEDVNRFLALKLPHVALYSLILENHTVFMNRERRGRLKLPSDDKNADMYEYIINRLLAEGFSHYEVSNFSKEGFESKHNLTYWDNSEYYGIGAGASGYLDGVRYKNRGPVHHYLQEGSKRITEEILSQKEMMEEEMFLGLRKKSGVSKTNFELKFNRSFNEIYGQVVAELTERELLVARDDIVQMTELGFELGNEVFQKFLLDEEK